MDNKIDFVITWVDESDPKWQKELEYYSAKAERTINTEACRFRDWGTLKYWFRGVEKFAPWVNKYFFVTYGHLPQWLDTSNPKLVVVKHEEFIPQAYLPTFNSNVIEYFFHKIEGLSDKFVYFNDDMFLIDNVSPERFFKNGLPCDIGGLSVVTVKGMFGCNVYRAVDLIRSIFNKKEAVSQNRSKWYSLRYPRMSLHNLLMYRLSVFPGFVNHHLPQGYLKETYKDVWAHFEKELKSTGLTKFREYGNVAHWIERYWQLAKGNFTPYNVYKDGRVFFLCDSNISESVDCITHQKKKIVCLNDGEHVTHFDNYKERILRAFEQILPEKSSFEL